MNFDEFAKKILKDGKYKKHTKELLKTHSDTKLPSLEDAYAVGKTIAFNIVKFLVLYWFVVKKFLPTQGIEKTAIFLMLIVIMLLINLARKRA